jgi:hypothetical protein
VVPSPFVFPAQQVMSGSGVTGFIAEPLHDTSAVADDATLGSGRIADEGLMGAPIRW